MEYRICPKCKKCVEVITHIVYEGGTQYIRTICPECNHVEQSTKSFIHYGNDHIG